MGRYRAGDLLLVPGLISLARLPLAVAFVVAIDRPVIELAVLGVAELTDIVDGWWARHFHRVTATGAVIDPVTDKLFVVSVVLSLVATERLTAVEVTLLATREIGELPLVLWWVLSRRRRRARAEQPMANLPGKLATVLQFATVALALFEASPTRVAVWVTACAGALAAVSYWARELRAVARTSAAPGR